MNTMICSKFEADWHRADVKAALEKSGHTLRGLSAAHGKSPNYCSRALDTATPGAQQLIAAAIGVPPQTIWPSRYKADGTPAKWLHRGSKLAQQQAALMRAHRVSLGADTPESNANYGPGV